MVNLSVGSKKFIRPHIGQGVSFPMRISKQGTIEMSADAINVRESIWLILLTKIGERVYRPNFGCRLNDLSFAPLNTETLMMMRIYVREALELWEPRIMLEQVVADPDPIEGRVDIIVFYRLQDNYEPGSIVYPFYLKTEPTPLD